MNTIKNKKILIDISGNTIQVIATQFFGLLIFYFTYTITTNKFTLNAFIMNTYITIKIY